MQLYTCTASSLTSHPRPKAGRTLQLGSRAHVDGPVPAEGHEEVEVEVLQEAVRPVLREEKAERDGTKQDGRNPSTDGSAAQWFPPACPPEAQSLTRLRGWSDTEVPGCQGPPTNPPGQAEAWGWSDTEVPGCQAHSRRANP